MCSYLFFQFDVWLMNRNDLRASPMYDTRPPGQSHTKVSRVPAVPKLQGRLAIDTFHNNITNIDASNYVWLKPFSNYSLCHKGVGLVQPTQTILWIVGDINRSNAQPYGA